MTEASPTLPAPESDSGHPAPRGRSYWRIVWQQFCRNRWAVGGLGMTGLFFAIAFFAPFLAHRLPLAWKAADGAWSFPLVREFFAPDDTTEPILEKAFNYIFLLVPLLILGGKLLRSVPARRVVLAAAALLLWVPFAGNVRGVQIGVQQRNDPAPYRQMAADGEGWGLFPLIPYGPNEQGFGPKVSPTWWSGGQKKEANHQGGYHLLGTDEIGRDVFVRVIHGARVSLSVGFVSVGIATLIGIIVGACAGYFGGIVDILLLRAIEIMICFPSFFLILTIIAVLDKRSILNIMLVIGITGWTGIARLIRAQVLRERKLDYVASATALGASDRRIIFRHILPNAVAPVLVSVTFGIAGAILTEAGLSFLGFGVAPPMPTWGELLNQAREAPLINWWLVMFPGIVIFLGVFAYNLVGEGLRDAMDPRMKR